MRFLKHTNILLAATFVILFTSCSKEESNPNLSVDPISKGKFENGFFLVNEGWFGHDPGDVNFYSYETGKLTDSIFKRENSAATLGTAGTTIEYATIYKDKFYLLSKAGGPLVAINPYTFKEQTASPQKVETIGVLF